MMTPEQTDPTTIRSVDVERMVTRLVDLQARIAELSGEAESLKAELRDSLVPGEYRAGESTFKIIPTRKFSPDLATSILPPDVIKDCLRVELDPAKLKANLTPAQLEMCMVAAGKSKVVL